MTTFETTPPAPQPRPRAPKAFQPTQYEAVCTAAIAVVAPRTVLRIYAGQPADETTRIRVIHAALALGLPPPPGASPASTRDITQLVIAARAVGGPPLPAAPRSRRTTQRRRRAELRP